MPCLPSGLATPCTALRRWRAGLALALLVAAAALNAGATEDTSVYARIARFEHQGMARPAEAAAALGALAKQLPAADPALVEALAVQGWLLASANDAAAAEQVAAQIDHLGASRPAQGPAAAVAAGLVRARVQMLGGSLGRADRLLGDALQRLPKAGDDLMRLRLAAALARVKEDAGHAEEGVRHYLRAVELADQLGHPWRRADMRRQLAWITAQLDQTERAVVLNQEALRIARQDDDQMLLSTIMNTEGFIQGKVGNKEAELRAMLAAIEHAEAARAPRQHALMLANLADYYLREGEFAVANAYAERALPLAREMKDVDVELVALANRGLARVSMRQFDTGKRDLEAAFAIDERRGSLSGMALTLEETGRYLERAGDLRGALDAYLRYRPLADQASQRDQQKAMLEMQEAFDHAQRQRDLALLEADGSLQREQLRAQSLKTRLWLLVALAGALALAVMALLARRVRQSNVALAQVNEQLQVQSECDPLTGLANRRRFQSALQLFARDGRLHGSVFLVDIDHFKRINDRFGHAAGDQVLVEIARRLTKAVRAGDLVVRWGGEEFLVVARNMSADAVEQMAQRVLDSIAGEPVAYEGHAIGVSASVGFATYPVEPSLIVPPWERAIDLVDTALYLAKAHGRNRGYGVRSLQMAHESELASIASSLEEAWRGGRVALTLLQGPRTQGVAA
jgi:diguanylate cyclase (GGDEF)-like protein